jgi:hypothetical protein
VRLFTCDNCGQLVFFENSLCLACETPLGYLHPERGLVALKEVSNGELAQVTHPDRIWRRCVTGPVTGCNWLVTVDQQFCASCALTRTRPNNDDVEGLVEFRRAETAKRRLIFQLAELGLPVQGRREESGIGGAAGSQRGLEFDLLSSSENKVVTGHDNGVITLDLAEADSGHREQLRQQLDEPYRTLLGHFRHEIGHYYWSLLVRTPDQLAASRALFGDDREDYAQAVQRHYAALTDIDESWQDTHISRYATMHPYEDWAETFAHYLHILDTLQTAESFGLGTMATELLARLTRRAGAHATRPDGSASFEQVIEHWLQLTYALNQINLSMGHEPLYPFVLAPTVLKKLSFVDQLVTALETA